MAATTTLLGLLTPTQGTLSGTWGDSVNYGISDYVDIAIAGTLSFAGDGAITLANTLGSASGNGITSTTAQYMVIRVTGTLTTPKIITGPSYSKLYLVDNAATGSTVTFKAAGQSGVSVAVGEECFVYYNGTDYIKVASSFISALTGTLGPANGGTGVANNAAMTVTGSGNFAYTRTLTGTTNVTFPTTGTLSTLAGSETLTNKTINGSNNTVTNISLTAGVTGTLPIANGGTGLTAGTSGGILAYTATGTLASSAALAANKVVIGGGAGVVPSTTTLLGTAAAVTTGSYIQAVGYADTVTALGNTGTAINLDVTSGNVFSATLNGNATITFRYPVATGSSSFTLILTNDGTAGRTVAWAGGTILFPGGAASLSRTTTANAVDVWFFFTPNGGTTWYGTIPMKNLIA
jgi:hypothetical protein